MDDVVSSIYSILNQQQEQPCCTAACSQDDHLAAAYMLNGGTHVILCDDVVDLNDKAVTCMIKADHNGALETLQVALARILAIQDHPSTTVQGRTSPIFANEESPLASIPLTQTVNHAPFDGIFVLFNRAMVIPRHCDFDIHNNPKNKSRALATILYNIALVYHMEAIQRGGDSAIFRYALNYYGWSYYVIESSSREFGFQDVLLLLLALFTNMGHIHADVYVNAEKTQQCLRWMQSTFAGKTIQRNLFPDDYKFFFQYVSMVSTRQLQLAPAA